MDGLLRPSSGPEPPGDVGALQTDISTLDTPELAALGSIDRKGAKKKWISSVFRISVMLLLFAFLFKSLSWPSLFVTFVHANHVFVLLTLIAGVFGLWISSYQWQIILQAERIRVGLVRLFNLYMVGIAFSHFLPTGMGGDAVKAYYVGRASGNMATSTSAVVMSRITGFWGMLLVAFPALLIWHEYFTHDVVFWFVLLSLGMVLMLGGAVFSSHLFPSLFKGKWTSHRIFAAAIRISKALSVSARRPRSLSVATLIGTVFWVVASLNYYGYAVALDINVPLYFYFLAIPMVSLVTFLPISINGFGVRESAFVYIFSTAHVSITKSLLIAFLMDLQVLFFGAIGGCLYLTSLGKETMVRRQRCSMTDVSRGYNSSASLEHQDVTRFMMSDQRQSKQTTLESELDSPTLKLVAKRCTFCRKILSRNDAQFCSNCGKPATSQSARSASQIKLRQTRAPSKIGYPQKKLPEEEPSTREKIRPPKPATYAPQRELCVKAWEREQPLDPRPVDHAQLEQDKSLPEKALTRTSRPMNQKKKYVLIIGSVVCLVVLLGVTVFYVSSDSPILWSLRGQADPDVTLYRVSLQNVTQYIGGGGIIFPRQQLDLSFPADERVISVLVKPGDEVHPQQALIRLDPAQLNAQVTQAANDVAAAQAYLYTVSATGNPITIAQAQQAYVIAKNKYNALVAETSSLTLQNGFLISPMKGIVTSVNINPGEVFTANTPLLTIMDELTVIVHVKIPLSNLEQVHVGQNAIVTPSALPNLNFKGTIKSIIPLADPQTATFEVWVEVVNSEKVLVAGMSAFVRIQGESTALVVPRLAVLNPAQEAVVFVVRDQHAYLQHVLIIGRSPDSIYIGAGLSPDDKVVLVGLDKLQNGQKIHVTNIEG